VTVLNLFGYTGLASLAVALAGAHVTHVDASKQSLAWARENQALSGVDASAIRWLVDDAQKFAAREVRRGARYEGIILDPPKFGRGPKGEVWKLHEALPTLLGLCRQLLSPRALFVLLNSYAADMTATSLYYALDDALGDRGGSLTAGELALREQSAGRLLTLASFASWARA
jgi:23S rRNA (cytosine1962-C5)-methyltransferase